MTARKVGERFPGQDGELDMIWTGTEWAPICPTDDVALTARDKKGWLYCTVCRKRVDELAQGGAS